ncbi:protein S-acyltransferase [Malassezia sp. CBS 17886]|nr:protein S-acyltransferase [Malassezia sp. CBS 17886]
MDGPNVYESVQQHLQHAQDRRGQAVSQHEPRYDAGDSATVTLGDHAAFSPYQADTDSMYHLQTPAATYDTGVVPYMTKSASSDSALSEAHAGAVAPTRGPYLDDKQAHFRSPYGMHWDESDAHLPLAANHSAMGFAEDAEDAERQLHHAPQSPHLMSNWVGMQDESASEKYAPRRSGGKFAWSNPELLERQIDARHRGVGRQAWPVLSWFFAVAFIAAFIAELIVAKQRTGEAIQIHPQVQPMIGPSAEFLISFGARFVPCMRKVPALPTTSEIPCLENSTSSQKMFSGSELCTIAHVCGLDDPHNPNQAYRFVTPVFLHAGIVHILFNLLVLLTLCAQIEKLIGSTAYLIVFMAGGIGGNLLGGSFGLIGQPSLGASGSIYAFISLEIVDLCYNWKYEMRAKMRVAMSIIFAIVGLALGLLPGIDNFAHIGGFCIGILGGLIFSPSIHATRTHMLVTWALRVVGLGLLVAFFVALTLNFYNSDDPADACSWCRYLSCLPAFNACKGYGISTAPQSTP